MSFKMYSNFPLVYSPFYSMQPLFFRSCCHDFSFSCKVDYSSIGQYVKGLLLASWCYHKGMKPLEAIRKGWNPEPKTLLSMCLYGTMFLSILFLFCLISWPPVIFSLQCASHLSETEDPKSKPKQTLPQAVISGIFIVTGSWQIHYI